MFGLWHKGVFVDFWQNKVDDEFLELTCAGMGFDINDVELVHYEGVKQPPKKYTIDNAAKSFTPITEIKKRRKVKSKDDKGKDIEYDDHEANGLPAYDIEDIPGSAVNPKETFFSKGTKLKKC